MRRREYYWSLYHLTDKKRLDDLKTDQVEAIFEAISPEQHREWVVWKEGFDTWKSFEDFPSLIVSLRRQPVTTLPKPPEPNRADELIKVPRDDETRLISDPHEFTASRKGGLFEPRSKIIEIGHAGPMSRVNTIDPSRFNDPTVSLSLDDVDDDDGRLSTRYQRRFELRIVTAHSSFKFWTLDLSLTGIRIEGALPHGLPKYFNVEIRTGDNIVPLVCSVFRENGNATSDRLKIEINDQVKVLQTLLLATG